MAYQKQDDNKNRLELIDPTYICGIGKVLTFGTIKYQPNNWKKAKPKDVDRVKGSLLRHTMAYIGGERYDPETGLEHLYHMGCNNMFLDWYDRNLGDNK